MAIRKILRAPSFFLTRLKAKPVDTSFDSEMKSIKRLAKDLVDTLKAYNGVGLSAIQINEHKRVIAVKPDKDKEAQIMINPVILEASDEMVDSDEACLSIPGLYGKVKRHKEVKLSFVDVNNNTITGVVSDLEGFIVQHEIDHLDGILFTDKCDDIHDVREEQNEQANNS